MCLGFKVSLHRNSSVCFSGWLSWTCDSLAGRLTYVGLSTSYCSSQPTPICKCFCFVSICPSYDCRHVQTHTCGFHQKYRCQVAELKGIKFIISFHHLLNLDLSMLMAVMVDGASPSKDIKKTENEQIFAKSSVGMWKVYSHSLPPTSCHTTSSVQSARNSGLISYHSFFLHLELISYKLCDAFNLCPTLVVILESYSTCETFPSFILQHWSVVYFILVKTCDNRTLQSHLNWWKYIEWVIP